MSKSNDTTKTRELTEAELAAVSGGLNLENCMISGVVAVGGSTSSGSGSAGWDLRQNKA